jgi:hypothetical protein
MRKILLLSSLCLVPTYAHSADTYDFEHYYASRPDAVFREPIKRKEENVSYALITEPDRSFVEYEAQIDQSTYELTLSEDDIEIGGTRYYFSRAFKLAGSIPIDPEYSPWIFFDTSRVFVSPSTDRMPAAVCIDASWATSGEEGRLSLSYLMISPPGTRAGTTPQFFEVYGLMAGCRAFVRTDDGRFALPLNTYIVNGMARTGMHMRYHALQGNRLVPTGETVELKFTEPEDPWHFSVVSR